MKQTRQCGLIVVAGQQHAEAPRPLHAVTSQKPRLDLTVGGSSSEIGFLGCALSKKTFMEDFFPELCWS